MGSGNGNAGAPAPENFGGIFHFPGTYAYLEQNGVVDFALLQINDPFTGMFDKQAAIDTCSLLSGRHMEGDEAQLSGKLGMGNVDGEERQILFMFD